MSPFSCLLRFRTLQLLPPFLLPSLKKQVLPFAGLLPLARNRSFHGLMCCIQPGSRAQHRILGTDALKEKSRCANEKELSIQGQETIVSLSNLEGEKGSWTNSESRLGFLFVKDDDTFQTKEKKMAVFILLYRNSTIILSISQRTGYLSCFLYILISISIGKQESYPLIGKKSQIH